MYHSKSLAFIGFLAAPALAFVPSSSVASRSFSSLSATRDPDNERATPPDVSRRNFAAASALTLGLLFPATDALAAEIKTMDFALPSSYDSIADPVASGTDELTQLTVINTAASKRKPKAAPTSDPKADAAVARADRVAQRKAKEAEQAILEEQAAKERDENIKAARMERIAARQAAQAEKEAAAAAKEDAKYKGAKFVDTSMPTY